MLGFFFFKQKTAYEMRISDWSSDVCSSDLIGRAAACRIPDRSHRSRLRPARRPCPRTLRPFPAPRCGLRPDPWRRGAPRRPLGLPSEIGRASCRERVCQYVEISVVAVSLTKKTKKYKDKH